MNKLEGFYELERVGLPSVPWKRYESGTYLDTAILWTVRSAVLTGTDLNLPRKIGVEAAEAKQFADELLNKLNKYDLVLYYPYFIAEKSGVLEISDTRTIIEAVKADLWNLVTYNRKNVTLIISDGKTTCVGDSLFLSQQEKDELLNHSKRARMRYRDLLSEGKSIFLEWSYAYVSDIKKTPSGERNLVFYEIRSV